MEEMFFDKVSKGSYLDLLDHIEKKGSQVMQEIHK
jgi:hypothetical protein